MRPVFPRKRVSFKLAKINVNQISSPRSLSVRKWVLVLGWVVLAGLFTLVHILPLPESLRESLAWFFLFLAVYLLFTFHYLFPRWNFTPNLIYATLAIDVLIVGALDFVLVVYLPDFELTFVPLIVASALVSNRRGTMLMALFAALVDFVAELRIVVEVSRFATEDIILNQVLIAGAFVVVGWVTVLLAESIRRRTLEASRAVLQAAEAEQRRRAEAERSAQRWEILNAVGLHVQEQSEPPRIFDVIRAQLKPLGLDFLIALWEEPDRILRVEYLSLAPALQKTLESLAGVSAKNIRFDVRQVPYFQQAVAQRQAILVDQTSHIEAAVLPHLPPKILEQILELTSASRRILAPLVVGEQVIGMFALWGRDLAAADLPAMTGLAHHIAIALDKARLLAQAEKRARQLAMVSEIAARAGSIADPQPFMNQVVRLIGENFGYHIAGILLVDRAQQDLDMAAAFGRLADRKGLPYRQAREVGIIGWVARNGQSYLARDVRSDPIYRSPFEGDDPVRSELTVPLKHGEEIFGVLDLQSIKVDAFDASDVAAMETLADQIAANLEKSKALAAHQKRASQLTVVNEIAERVASAPGVDALMGEVARLIVERFGFENASILLNDSPAREIVLRAHAGMAINLQQIDYRQPWEVGLLGLAVRTGRTVVANDVRVEPNYYTTDKENDTCRAELTVPLRRGAQILGVMDVQSTRVNAFEPSDVIVLETLANQLAIALEKADLFAAERKRAAQLALASTIAQRAASILDANRLLDEVVRLIHERFGYFDVSIFTLDANRRELVMRANAGFPQPPIYRQSIDVGLIGAAARTGTLVVVNDASQDPRYFLATRDAAAVRSEMCVPLKIGERVIGVLDIESTELNAFDPSDAASMEVLANQIAIALDNARLYARTKDDAEVKSALLRELSHRVKNNLTAIAGLLYMGLDDNQMSREQVLNESLTRIQSMAVAHSLLVNSPWARLDVLELGRRVLKDSIGALMLPGRTVPVTVTGESVEISAKQASSLALVLNELVTNAIKHGGRHLNHLSLTVQRVEGSVHLEFYSQGDEPPDFHPELDSAGLGLKLIRTLVEKDLRGSFSLAAREQGVLGLIQFAPEELR